jgi:uncharacterized protein (TIGR03067 family)
MRNAMLVVLLALPVGWLAFAEPEKSKAPAKDSFSSEQIAKLLKDLGYEPQALADEVHQVSIDREGWKIHIMVSLAHDADRIWLECKFAPIAQPEIVPASVWQRLLEENERIGPAYFTFDKSDKRIHLYKAFDNVGVNPARLKKELDGFDVVVRRTQEVWRSDKFAPAEIVPIAPRIIEAQTEEADNLKGKWRIIRVETKGESITEERLTASKYSLTIDGDKAVLKMGIEPERKVKLKLDAKKKPKQIEFIDDKDRIEKGIWIIETGLLTICVAGAGEDHPRQFVTDPKNRNWLLVLKKDE